ncbi:putative RDH13 [Operophtera brumata]|uniref:Putative RDH13 n=1 Tax=Operophtera brumata TaxID=104452 RepID=A0A0L7LKJ0_OPEBR|nr:putative RDH13 [Operophtera brumata]
MWYIWLVLTLVLIKLYNKWSTGKFYDNSVMSGKVVIVTGGNSGIGYATALELAKRGAKVILGCRDNKKGLRAVERIKKRSRNTSVRHIHLDLASFTSVRKFVEEFKNTEAKLDVLINNAGTSGISQDYTEDGVVTDMQINHFGPFLLTLLLVPMLKKSAPSRVVIVSSVLHRFGRIDDLNEMNRYTYVQAFCNSKLCNVLFTTELARRLDGTGVVVNSAHPGQVNTSLYKSTIFEKLRSLVLYSFFKSPYDGAQTSVYLAVSDECDQITGGYFADCEESKMSLKVNEISANKLWSYSESLVKLRPEETI